MAILQALLTILFKSIGRLLNTAVGWATIMLFGKVPQKRQIYLSFIAFGSLVWILFVLGILFPRLAAFLLAFIQPPPWIANWIRLVMVVGTLFLPAGIGALSLLLLDPAARPKGIAGKARMIFRGYPYTVGLALTLIMMIVIAPVFKARDIIRRWRSAHIPVLVDSQNYLEVVGDIEQALGQGGIHAERVRASWMLRWPTRLLALFAGPVADRLVADQLTTLRTKKMEILLHPSDLVIRGRPLDVARIQATLAARLTFTKAHLTWSKEANEVEDRLLGIWCRIKGSAGRGASDRVANELREVERQLHVLRLPYEEWEVLFRSTLLVERELWRVGGARPALSSELSPESTSQAEERAEQLCEAVPAGDGSAR